MPGLRTTALGIGLALALARAAPAANQYWDTGAGAGLQGGNGTWSTTDLNWSDTRVGTALSAWTAGNDAWFVVPSNGTPSAITVSSSFNVNSVTIDGSFYALTVSGGGQMLAGAAASTIGSGSSSNTVTVTGSGSRWNAGAMNLGSGASAMRNQIVVANGGWLVNGAVTIGQPSSGSNSVTVTGAGSVWSNTSYVSFANTTPAVGNSITVANGGLAYVATTLAPNNSERTSFTVTDPGSALRIGTGFFLGAGPLSSFTSLVISNSGRVVSPSVSFAESGGSWNTAVVTGSGSVWSNTSGTLTIGNGVTATNNSLLIANGGQVVNLGSAAIGAAANTPDTCASNSATITGSGSVWTNSGDIKLSTFKNSKSNYMKILDGGVVYSAGGTIGSFGGIAPPAANDAPPTISNYVVMSGAGSMWNLGNQLLTIGGSGSGVATNGGLASNNWLTVGAGAAVTNVSTLNVNTNNTLNLFGGVATATTLTLQPDARIGLDVVTPGRIVVQGNATLNGYVNPTNLPRIGSTTRTILTCAGTISGNLSVGPLPTGYTGSILTNLAATPKQVDLYVVGPSGGTIILIAL